MKYLIFGFIAGLIAIALLLGFVHIGGAGATQVEKQVWCHCEPNGNCQTLELPLAALINAGHVSAQGNPLHAGDHAGVCVAPSPTPEVSPTPTECEGDCEEPTVTPTEAPKVETNSGGPGDGRSDGLNDGKGCQSHDCSTHDNFPKSNFDGSSVGWK